MELLRWSWICFAAAVTCCAEGTGCASRPATRPENDQGLLFRTLRDDLGESHRYAVYVPHDLDPSQPAPAIVFLHGAGECGTDGTRHLTVGLMPAVLKNPERWPFIVVLPQKPDRASAWASHERMVLGCLEATARTHRIDRTRVYLTGLSQGGAGTWSIGASHPEMFAALAPVCGFLHDPAGAEGRYGTSTAVGSAAERLAASGLPIWAFHGERDRVIPPDRTREFVRAIRDARPGREDEVKATYFAEADHNSWDAAYGGSDGDLAAWFLAHRRASRP